MTSTPVQVLKIRPLEPLLLRGPGEFDPSARGVSSFAASRTWPSPSTIAGLIISHLVSQLPGSSGDWNSYVDRSLSILDTLGIHWVRGPYFTKRAARPMVPFRTTEGLLLVDVHQLRYFFKKHEEGIATGRIDSFKKFEEAIGKLPSGDCFQPKLLDRIGISLSARVGSKAVREGYLYAASYVDLGGGSIAVEVGAANSLSKLNRAGVAFGGERRIAVVEVETADVNQRFASAEFTGGYALLLSPLVLPPPLKILRNGASLRVGLAGNPDDFILEIVLGGVGVTGLGFSLADRSRKPIYPAVLEGSIVKVSDRCPYTAQLGAYACLDDPTPLITLLGRTGYGSMTRVVET